MSREWIPKTFEQACKRAAGRRRYHAKRQRARDERQLVIMGLLSEIGWANYGAGRILAKCLSVHSATISRDLKYLREWRASFITQQKITDKYADAVIERLVTARIHPRCAFSWMCTYYQGVSSLKVHRLRKPKLSKRGILRPGKSIALHPV